MDFGELTKVISPESDEFIDIRNEVGLKIWVRKNHAKSIVTFLFHHAATDGIGSYQFIGDVLYFYAELSGVSLDQKLPDLDQGNLRNRLRSSFPVERYVDSSGKFRFEWRESAMMLLGRVANLRKHRKGFHSGSSHFASGNPITYFRKRRLSRLAA